MAKWLKLRNERRGTSNGAYVSIETGNRVGVREYSHFGTKHEIWFKPGQQPAEVLGDGYATEAEALSALDEFMSEYCDVIQLQVPEWEQAQVEASVNGDEEEEVK